MGISVSGEIVSLDGSPFVLRALDALRALPHELPDYALVGGLAVTIRLAEAHRATGDVDLVTIDETRTIELLVGRDATRTRNGVRLESGVELDVIDASDPPVVPQPEHDDIERGAIERQLVFAHALATSTSLVVSPVSTLQRAENAEIRVASAGALVALKCHALVDPRRQRVKRGSDVYDVVRLLRRFGTAAISRDIRATPSSIVESTCRHLQRIMLDEADRSAGLLRASTVLGVEAVVPEQLELLGSALLAELA